MKRIRLPKYLFLIYERHPEYLTGERSNGNLQNKMNLLLSFTKTAFPKVSYLRGTLFSFFNCDDSHSGTGVLQYSYLMLSRDKEWNRSL
jgi:hypothetical protein